MRNIYNDKFSNVNKKKKGAKEPRVRKKFSQTKANKGKS